MNFDNQSEEIALRSIRRDGLLAMTNRLTFRLSGFRTSGLILAICLAIFSSCSPNPNMQGKGETYLQGEWQQDSVAGQQKLISYSVYHLKFDCDSFFFSINNFSKVNAGADTCTASGHWHEYVKGNYTQRNDTLFLKGFYANANFTLKEEGGCFNTGPYQAIIKVTKKSDSLIQFANIGDVLPINAHLIKRTTCTLKPL